MSDLFSEYGGLPRNAQLILPSSFEDALTYADQLRWLFEHKQATLIEGDGITMEPTADGKIIISAEGGSSEDGVGIRSITGVVGDTGTTVTVLLTDNTTQEFFVERGVQGIQGEPGTNGQNGTDGADGADGVGISNIVFKETDISGNNIYTVNLSDTTSYDITCPRGPQGVQGEQGEQGVGISNVAFKEIDQYGNNVYTITLTNSNTYDFVSPIGATGSQGLPGTDGVSPTANVTQTSEGAVVTVTDAQGTTTATLTNGTNGTNGANGTDGADGVGISTITFKETDQYYNNVYTITLTNSNTYDITCPRGPKGSQGVQGIQGEPGTNGQNGTDGTDGVGIYSIVFKTTDDNGNNVYQVNLTDTTSYDITCPIGPAGSPGTAGSTGPAGPGVPTGGTIGQYLRKKSYTDYDTEWATMPTTYRGSFKIGEDWSDVRLNTFVDVRFSEGTFVGSSTATQKMYIVVDADYGWEGYVRAHTNIDKGTFSDTGQPIYLPINCIDETDYTQAASIAFSVTPTWINNMEPSSFGHIRYRHGTATLLNTTTWAYVGIGTYCLHTITNQSATPELRVELRRLPNVDKLFETSKSYRIILS